MFPGVVPLCVVGRYIPCGPLCHLVGENPESEWQDMASGSFGGGRRAVAV
jgi:hypothetical protein